MDGWMDGWMDAFVGVAQIDDVRLLGGEGSGEESVARQRTTSFQVQRLDPIARCAVQHVHVRFRIN